MGEIKYFLIIRQIILLLVLIFFLPFVFYYIFLFCLGYMKGYDCIVIDLDHDGKVSIKEMINASDIGRYSFNTDNMKCDEYFSYKDGSTIKIICTKSIQEDVDIQKPSL